MAWIARYWLERKNRAPSGHKLFWCPAPNNFVKSLQNRRKQEIAISQTNTYEGRDSPHMQQKVWEKSSLVFKTLKKKKNIHFQYINANLGEN